ncbi:kinase-like domain-containing protein, partial [Hyaloscypha finlandica]
MPTLAHLISRSPITSFDAKASYISDIFCGLAAIHSFGIFHNDLKPNNVLVFKIESRERDHVCKLSDFGLS